jgi:DNA-binding NtrC family response regulator
VRFTTIEATPGTCLKIGRSELQLMSAVPSGRVPLSERNRFGQLLGRSTAMRAVFAVLERVSPTDTSVLILGATGTAKELCAESIHAASERAKAPWVVCDLSAVAPNLIESELFGHLKGAFTGASEDRPGIFEKARGGTVFLDEVGELPRELQPRLLRFLERRQLKPVGSDDYRTVDVRVIAATHRNLEAEARAGRFRADLLHRLAVVTVQLPPLRERREDIPLLVDQILERLDKRPGVLSPGTLALLKGHSWPGNVRELRNVVERAISLGMPMALERSPAAGAAPRLSFRRAKAQLVNAFERDYVADLLSHFQGNISEAAREGGIDRVHLHRLIKKYALGKS